MRDLLKFLIGCLFYCCCRYICIYVQTYKFLLSTRLSLSLNPVHPRSFVDFDVPPPPPPPHPQVLCCRCFCRFLVFGAVFSFFFSWVWVLTARKISNSREWGWEMGGGREGYYNYGFERLRWGGIITTSGGRQFHSAMVCMQEVKVSKCEMSKLVGAGRKCQVPRRDDCLN